MSDTPRTDEFDRLTQDKAQSSYIRSSTRRAPIWGYYSLALDFARTLERELNALRAKQEPDAHPPASTTGVGACTWTADEWDGSWDTSCGQKYCIEDGTPEDNNMHWCCFCGHELRQAALSGGRE